MVSWLVDWSCGTSCHFPLLLFAAGLFLFTLPQSSCQFAGCRAGLPALRLHLCLTQVVAHKGSPSSHAKGPSGLSQGCGMSTHVLWQHCLSIFCWRLSWLCKFKLRMNWIKKGTGALVSLLLSHSHSAWSISEYYTKQRGIKGRDYNTTKEQPTAQLLWNNPGAGSSLRWVPHSLNVDAVTVSLLPTTCAVSVSTFVRLAFCFHSLSPFFFPL